MANAFKGILAAGVVGSIAWAFREYQKGIDAQEPQFVITPAASTPAPQRNQSLFGTFLGNFAGNLFDSVPAPIQDAVRSVAPVVAPDVAAYIPPAAPVAQAPAWTPAPRGGRETGPNGINFAAKERQYNLPAGYLHRTGEIESSLNPNAQNPRSSAGGLFQFIDSTARQYGLIDRFDPVQATDAAARLASDNKAILTRATGRNPSAAELYLAHQQGGTGASRLLSNPNAPANTIVSTQAVRLNGGNTSMTAQEFANLWINKFNRGFL
jgi:hypothetical protein